MVVTQHVTYRGGGFAEGLVVGERVLEHTEQHSSVYRLHTVSHVGQGSAHDHTHGIVDVGALDLLFDLNMLNVLTFKIQFHNYKISCSL